MMYLDATDTVGMVIMDSSSRACNYLPHDLIALKISPYRLVTAFFIVSLCR